MSACLQILKRINAEIEARRKAGEDLPPPPKTAIAGPEYFGLNQPNVGCGGGRWTLLLCSAQLCTLYPLPGQTAAQLTTSPAFLPHLPCPADPGGRGGS
jgi:hypothetical protein